MIIYCSCLLLLFIFTFAVGLYYCFSNLSDARIFIIMYGVTSMYFSAVMVRNALSHNIPALDSEGHDRIQNVLMSVHVFPSEYLRGWVVKLFTVAAPSQGCITDWYILVMGPNILGFITLCQEGVHTLGWRKWLWAGFFPFLSVCLRKRVDIFPLKPWEDCQVLDCWKQRDFIYYSKTVLLKP